jgi:four helix bundle protein
MSAVDDIRERALALAEAVLRLPAARPADPVFVLLVQLRRAAVAVPAQHAQAGAQLLRVDRQRFLGLVLGTLAELDALLELAGRSGAVDGGTAAALRGDAIELARRLRAASRALDVPAPRDWRADDAHDD